MQWSITKQTQINSSWTDIITVSLMPLLQNMKTRNDGMECINQCAHIFLPSHTPHWFASTPPVRESSVSDSRQPTSSDFACWIRAAPEASSAAELTKHICSQPHLSLPNASDVQWLGRCVSAFKLMLLLCCCSLFKFWQLLSKRSLMAPLIFMVCGWGANGGSAASEGHGGVVLSNEAVLAVGSDAWVGVSRSLDSWRTMVSVPRESVALDIYTKAPHLSRRLRPTVQGSWMLANQSWCCVCWLPTITRSALVPIILAWSPMTVVMHCIVGLHPWSGDLLELGRIPGRTRE